jgi:hypothetical protein
MTADNSDDPSLAYVPGKAVNIPFQSRPTKLSVGQLFCYHYTLVLCALRAVFGYVKSCNKQANVTNTTRDMVQQQEACEVPGDSVLIQFQKHSHFTQSLTRR